MTISSSVEEGDSTTLTSLPGPSGGQESSSAAAPLTSFIPKDKRGKSEAANKKDKTLIYNHIESFNPAISHFRRYHSPNVRYLPTELSASWMFKDFHEKHPDFSCSYELYRKTFKEMNISFSKP